MRRALWAALLAAGACQSEGPSAIDPGLAPELQYVSLLIETEAGAPISATGLVERSAGAAFEAELERFDDRDGLRVHLAGWTAASLSALELPPADVLASRPISRAGPEDPLLPAPSHHSTGAYDGDLIELSDSTEPLELTAPWLPRCPGVPDQSFVVDGNCNPLRCDARLRREGCGVVLDTGNCLHGELRGTMDGRGKFSLGVGTGLGPCAPIETSKYSHLTLGCQIPGDRCTIDLYPSAALDRVFARAEAISLTGGPEVDSSRLTRQPAGYLHGLALLEDRVVASTSTAVADDALCRVPSRSFALIDRASGGVRLVPAPACAGGLTRDSGPGFLAVFRPGNELRLGRFDPEGTEVTSVAIAPGLGAGHYVSRLSASVPGSVVYVSIIRDDGMRTKGRLAAFDLVTLERRWITEEIVGFASDADFLHADRIALLDADQDDYHFLDGDGNIALVAPISLACGVQSPRIQRGLHHRPSNQLVAAAADGNAELFVITAQDQSGCRALSFYSGDAEPLALGPWPGDAGLISVGLKTESGEALIAVADPSAARFLPGKQVIGRGWVTELAADDRELWAALPSTGHVVRIVPVE